MYAFKYVTLFLHLNDMLTWKLVSFLILDIFFSLQADTLCDLLKRLANNCEDIMSKCSILLLLVKKFPNQAREYGVRLSFCVSSTMLPFPFMIVQFYHGTERTVVSRVLVLTYCMVIVLCPVVTLYRIPTSKLHILFENCYIAFQPLLITTLFEAELKESPNNIRNVYRRYFGECMLMIYFIR